MHGKQATGEDAALSFGNAARHSNLAEQQERRARRFRDWIEERTGGAVIVPERFVDFSQQKTVYAHAILNAPNFFARVRDGLREFRWLMHSLWLRPEDTVMRKMALTVWALVLFLIPKSYGRPLALYVCNPASR
jgi:hypothetical protein